MKKHYGKPATPLGTEDEQFDLFDGDPRTASLAPAAFVHPDVVEGALDHESHRMGLLLAQQTAMVSELQDLVAALLREPEDPHIRARAREVLTDMAYYEFDRDAEWDEREGA